MTPTSLLEAVVPDPTTRPAGGGKPVQLQDRTAWAATSAASSSQVGRDGPRRSEHRRLLRSAGGIRE
jgi:hypothetical protein